MCAGHDNCEWWEHIDWNVDPKSGFAGGACTLKKCMPGKIVQLQRTHIMFVAPANITAKAANAATLML